MFGCKTGKIYLTTKFQNNICVARFISLGFLKHVMISDLTMKQLYNSKTLKITGLMQSLSFILNIKTCLAMSKNSMLSVNAC